MPGSIGLTDHLRDRSVVVDQIVTGNFVARIAQDVDRPPGRLETRIVQDEEVDPSISIVVTPVCRSPLIMAQFIGAAPRYSAKARSCPRTDYPEQDRAA